MKKSWKIAGLSFDHMHMGDLLRQVHQHPNAEIVGICDNNPDNAEGVNYVRRQFGLAEAQVFTDPEECLDRTKPDIVILCPATGRHADWVEMAAPSGAHLLVEKPFAASLADADRMIEAVRKTGRQMIVNWPLAWYPPHLTAKRILDEGMIGALLEVHFYDGNRGPTRHLADKIQVAEEEADRRVATTWWYQKAHGGGSLLDYLGYGVTLGTWYQGGRAPLEVTSTTWNRPHLEVDEHSVTVARYAHGLSKFETRWGTFTDPWVMQPQPKCGFVLVGSAGTIANYDYEQTIRIQTRQCPEGFTLPVDPPQPGLTGPVEHFIEVLENGVPVHGPLSIPICRIGQQIVDTAYRSAFEKRSLPLLP